VEHIVVNELGELCEPANDASGSQIQPAIDFDGTGNILHYSMTAISPRSLAEKAFVYLRDGVSMGVCRFPNRRRGHFEPVLNDDRTAEPQGRPFSFWLFHSSKL